MPSLCSTALICAIYNTILQYLRFIKHKSCRVLLMIDFAFNNFVKNFRCFCFAFDFKILKFVGLVITSRLFAAIFIRTGVNASSVN